MKKDFKIIQMIEIEIVNKISFSKTRKSYLHYFRIFRQTTILHFRVFEKKVFQLTHNENFYIDFYITYVKISFLIYIKKLFKYF